MDAIGRTSRDVRNRAAGISAAVRSFFAHKELDDVALMSGMVGTRPGKRAVDFQEAITIDAPVEEVFDYLSDFGNWPRIGFVEEYSGALPNRPLRLRSL